VSINELNREVRNLLPGKIYWTGFKADQSAPIINPGTYLYSQLGWFKDWEYVAFALTLGEIEAANPSEVARTISDLWEENHGR
jgi:hypothetical protein